MKIVNLLAVFAAMIAFVGGTSYLLTIDEYVCAMCNVVLAVLAWPKVKELLDELF